MPPVISTYILNYGYLAIFLLVLIQTIGFPNPVPVEFILMFAGYLTFTHLLGLPLVLFVAILGDFTGATIVYFVFYFSGTYILRNKPRWLAIPERIINNLRARSAGGGIRTIYIGRFIPFVRGYISVVAGLLQIKPTIFLPVVFISSGMWALICLMIGRLIAPYWNSVENHFGSVKFVMLLIAAGILVFGSYRYYKSVIKKKESALKNFTEVEEKSP